MSMKHVHWYSFQAFTEPKTFGEYPAAHLTFRLDRLDGPPDDDANRPSKCKFGVLPRNLKSVTANFET